jgi:hypothetical protein
MKGKNMKRETEAPRQEPIPSKRSQKESAKNAFHDRMVSFHAGLRRLECLKSNGIITTCVLLPEMSLFAGKPHILNADQNI